MLGQAVYLFLYNPLTGETHALFASASLAACVVPALTYWIAAKLFQPSPAAAPAPGAAVAVDI